MDNPEPQINKSVITGTNVCRAGNQIQFVLIANGRVVTTTPLTEIKSNDYYGNDDITKMGTERSFRLN